MTDRATYDVALTGRLPELSGLWDGPSWGKVAALSLAHYRPEGTSHRPETLAKLVYDSSGIFGIFRVTDRYVRCVNTGYTAPVCKDSCVEFFLLPKTGGGYFNFEFNCGGALLASYITDPERTVQGFKAWTALSERDCRQVLVFHSLPEIVDPEIAEPMVWCIEFFIPFSLLSEYAGPLGHVRGSAWRANFYKCGDETSHPHWASWTPLTAKNFHLPDCFGIIRFA